MQGPQETRYLQQFLKISDEKSRLEAKLNCKGQSANLFDILIFTNEEVMEFLDQFVAIGHRFWTCICSPINMGEYTKRYTFERTWLK